MTTLLPAEQGEAVDRAVDLLQAGDVVVFPTDTVYGIGASALSLKGVEKIFSVKARPRDKPIIIYVASPEQLRTVTQGIPESADEALNHLWPGAVSVVFYKNGAIPDMVTSGQKTIGTRMPDHALCLELVRRVGCPLAVTSANVSGKATPETASEAAAQLGESVPLILDGGPSRGGVPSTIIDYTQSPPLVLRKGVLSLSELRRFIPELSEG